jgi:hypothetical protein
MVRSSTGLVLPLALLLALLLAAVDGSGARAEKLGGSLTMLMVSRRGMRRGWEGTTGVGRTVAMRWTGQK